MNLKKYTQYHVNFDSKWINTCGALLGLSFFLRIVYYFGLMNLQDVGALELVTTAIIGIILCGGFVVCLICLHLNAPGLFGMIGAVQCLILMLSSLTAGSPVRIVLAILWYALCAAVLLITVGGYLPGRLLGAGMFWFAAFVRLVFFDLGKIGLFRWVLELAILSAIIGLGCFVMGLKSAKRE